MRGWSSVYTAKSICGGWNIVGFDRYWHCPVGALLYVAENVIAVISPQGFSTLKKSNVGNTKGHRTGMSKMRPGANEMVEVLIFVSSMGAGVGIDIGIYAAKKCSKFPQNPPHLKRKFTSKLIRAEREIFF